MQVIDLITVNKLVTLGLSKLFKSSQLQSLALVTVRMCNVLHARMAQRVQEVHGYLTAKATRQEDWLSGWLLVPSESAGRNANPAHTLHTAPFTEGPGFRHLMTTLQTTWAVGSSWMSPHTQGKLAAPLAHLSRKNSQVISRALPTPCHANLHRQQAGTAGEDIRWGGRKPSVGAEYICCRPTHLLRIKSTSSTVTDPNVCVVLPKPSSFAETQMMAQEKTWFLQRTKQGLTKDLSCFPNKVKKAVL